MSKITGIPDFQDFIEKEGVDYLSKIKIYVGYYNYLMDNAIDVKDLKDFKDWAKFFRYTIVTKSLYRNLGGGYIVLSDRDYISEQDDKALTNEARRRIRKMREANVSYLAELDYTEEEALELSRYKFELEEKIK